MNVPFVDTSRISGQCVGIWWQYEIIQFACTAHVMWDSYVGAVVIGLSNPNKRKKRKNIIIIIIG